MDKTIKIKIIKDEDLHEYSTENELDDVFPGWKELNKSSRGILEQDEGNGLDFIIQKKLETIAQLNDQIDQLEKKVQQLLAHAKTAQNKIRSCPKQPTMKDLLQYCSTLKDAVSGKLTPDRKG
jgi:predicted  nucleic acid-binding Zn-ribbon protein